MIEPVHLRIVAALKRHGTLTEAADTLCLSQSALSHQIRHLEKKLGIDIWEKEGRRLRLTRAGDHLLAAAHKILPLLEQSERTLKAYAEGKQGILRIGVECYPCYEWLTGVMGEYLKTAADVEVDIFHQFKFTGIEGLSNRHIDMLITPDRAGHPGLDYEPLFDYELVLLTADSHPLGALSWVEPERLARETLITFPVAPERLDILTRFLWPAAVRPAKHKQIESVEVMLQLVSFDRGVCALPGWLADRVCRDLPLKSVRLGRHGVQRKLYAAFRDEDADIRYLQQFIRLGKRFPFPREVRVSGF
ncbi:MAG: LysR family transcriptional regulator [Candidatus Thiodiazotropha sp. (ex Epidulcina cf. delphinae)]|nr:LysR family transcriptional regulator [Candidatus Thiodiazotropha sp. (ex Epidulcina cf. delphinae)]